MHKVVCFFILSIFFAVFLYANFPAFKGFFVYPEVRVAIPEEYFETFSFFNSQLSYGKIANFPQPTFWGWVNYDWGYRGSGFPWYGVKQPILDRVFDVWSPQTEHYYDQITFALYTKNPTLFKSVLNKYQVKYIWLDERVILPHNPDGLFYPELKQFLVDSTDYKKVFSSGKQSIYEIQFLTNEYFSVNSASSISSTNTDSLYDLTYSTFGDYYSDLSKPASRFVPFANVAYPVSQIPFVTKSDGLYLESSLPTDGYLQYPSTSANNTSFWVTALLSGKTLLYDELNPKVLLDGEVVLHSTAGGMIDLSSNTFESGLVLINNVLIQPKVPTALNLFADSNSSVVFNSSTRTYAITSKIKTLELNNCLDFVDNGTKYIYESSSSNEFTLSGTHSRPCKYARIMDIVNLNGFDLGGKRQVVEVSFDYFSPSGEKPTICLSKEGSTKCVYKVGYELTPTTADWDTATFRIYGYDIPLKELWLKYELDASSKDEQLSITFRDLKLRIYQDVLFEDVFSLSQSQIATGDSSNTFLEDTSVMPVKKDQKLDVYLGDFSNANGVYTIYPQDTVANKDCYQLGAGTHAETVGFDKQEGIYVNFLSKDASSCNFYSIPNKYLSSGFLVKIRTKNISGRPLKASIKLDPPGYYFLQEILRVPSNQWEDVYYFVPSVAYSPAQNVFLEIDNYAVGKEVRENYLKNIAIMPVNYNFINTLSVTTEKQASSTVSTNNSVFSVTRLAPFIYKVNVEKLEIPDVKDKSIIFQLNEAFHSGWVMLKGVTVMPNHVISDSWANGWVVEPGSVGEYTAIFVPQALEFLGFFGLFVVCLLLIIRKERLK
ncbi:MAG: hypothetical protein ACD_22C00257G0007 [uncultured bacterium]|nr:MAG: hypothetical protein ACD_22C00257G0007 [uncultured bacterium]